MLARLLGKIASSFLAVPHGKLHYREMERQKTESLKNSYGNFEQLIVLSTTSLTEIHCGETI